MAASPAPANTHTHKKKSVFVVWILFLFNIDFHFARYFLLRGFVHFIQTSQAHCHDSWTTTTTTAATSTFFLFEWNLVFFVSLAFSIWYGNMVFFFRWRSEAASSRCGWRRLFKHCIGVHVPFRCDFPFHPFVFVESSNRLKTLFAWRCKNFCYNCSRIRRSLYVHECLRLSRWECFALCTMHIRRATRSFFPLLSASVVALFLFGLQVCLNVKRVSI